MNHWECDHELIWRRRETRQLQDEPDRIVATAVRCRHCDFRTSDTTMVVDDLLPLDPAEWIASLGWEELG